MNRLKTSLLNNLLMVMVVAVGLLGTACETLTYTPDSEPTRSREPKAADDPVRASVGLLQSGDLVKIDFSGPSVPPQPHEEHIKDDGTISLYLVGSVKAAGKTAGQLQQEIQALYVPRFYKNLNVTVKAADRFYFVGGEVKAPNRQLYLGPITVTGAIKSSGDFTEFANKRKVTVVRADGTKKVVDALKAQENPELDLPVYPGDRITVPPRFF